MCVDAKYIVILFIAPDFILHVGLDLSGVFQGALVVQALLHTVRDRLQLPRALEACIDTILLPGRLEVPQVKPRCGSVLVSLRDGVGCVPSSIVPNVRVLVEYLWPQKGASRFRCDAYIQIGKACLAPDTAFNLVEVDEYSEQAGPVHGFAFARDIIAVAPVRLSRHVLNEVEMLGVLMMEKQNKRH